MSAKVDAALEALYALSSRLPPVNQFFIDPALHEDADLAARLAAIRKAHGPASIGVFLGSGLIFVAMLFAAAAMAAAPIDQAAQRNAAE